MKIIPIRFNKDQEQKLAEIEDLLGLSNVYGSTPKIVKFCIDLALSALKDPEKVYFYLDQEEIELYFKTRTKIEIHKKRQEEAQKILIGSNNV